MNSYRPPCVIVIPDTGNALCKILKRVRQLLHSVLRLRGLRLRGIVG